MPVFLPRGEDEVSAMFCMISFSFEAVHVFESYAMATQRVIILPFSTRYKMAAWPKQTYNIYIMCRGGEPEGERGLTDIG